MGLSYIGAWALRTRGIVRAPIWLYRHRLGWLMGSRILMLEHRGRVSGEARYVCLEVVERPGPGRLVIVSGFGEHAQWYRNLQADPRCFVSTGQLQRVPANAVMMTEAEARAAIERYQQAHPADWRFLRSTIETAVGHPVDGLPMVELVLGGA